MRSPAVPVTMWSQSSRTLDTGNLRVTEAWFPPHAALPPHTHDRAIVSVMLRGGFRTQIGGRSLACEAGSAWTEPRESQHANYAGAGGAHVVIVQPDHRQEELFEPYRCLLEEVHQVKHPMAVLDASRVRAEIQARDPLTAICVEATVVMLLSSVARLRHRDGNGHRAPGWLVRARDVLHDTWRADASLSAVSNAVNVHPSHLAHTFREYYGESLGAYVRKLRLTWAVTRLATTDEPLSQIALAAGYSDQSHFTRDCKRHTGLSPGALRATLRPMPIVTAPARFRTAPSTMEAAADGERRTPSPRPRDR